VGCRSTTAFQQQRLAVGDEEHMKKSGKNIEKARAAEEA